MKKLGAPQPFLLAGHPEEDDAALGAHALGGTFGVGAGHGKKSGGPGPVVIGAVVDVVAVGERRAQSDMIEVSADHQVFVLQNGVAAFEHGDDVLGVVALAFDRDLEGQLLLSGQFEGFLLSGVVACGVEDLRAVGLLAIENGGGHGQARGHAGNRRTRLGRLEFGRL